MEIPQSAPSLIADRYEVGELIGRGGMADVHAGTDRRLDRPVAVKLLQGHMAALGDVRTRFEAEARSAARLTSPHSVAVFDTGEHDGVPYIVMERLPGRTLADRIAEGPLDPGEVRPLALEVLAALGEAHQAGLIHRDVKPGNILLTADGHAKLADFGIAKSVQESSLAELTVTGQVLGTPAYLAPEQLDGASATPRSDIYAVGVVLYEALTGAKPFAGTTPMSMARAVVAGDHPALGEQRPDLDPVLVRTVERAMATDPGRRFASVVEMAGALSAGPTPPTMAAPRDATMVLDAGSVPGPIPAGAGPVPAAARRPSLPLRLALVAGVIVVALVVLLRACAQESPPDAAGPGQEVAPTSPLVRDLRAEADRLSPADGARATELAGRLRQVADQVATGGGGPAATGLIVAVATWNRDRQLANGATVTALTLLQQVPGATVPTTVAPAPTPTVAPTPAPTRAPPTTRRSNDKDKDKDD